MSLELLMKKAIEYLSQINKMADGEDIMFPVNSVQERHAGYGMVSYPNFQESCRSLNYPNLDHFYHACDVTGFVLNVSTHISIAILTRCLILQP